MMDLYDLRRYRTEEKRDLLCTCEEGYIFIVQSLTKDSTFKEIDDWYSQYVTIIGDSVCGIMEKYQLSDITNGFPLQENIKYAIDKKLEKYTKEEITEITSYFWWGNFINTLLLLQKAKEIADSKEVKGEHVREAYRFLMLKELDRRIEEFEKEKSNEQK